MSQRPKFKDIDAYISTFPADIQAILSTIRKKVKEKLPDAREIISYQMPAFRQKKVFFFFAAFKEHIGIYPPVKGDNKLQQDLKTYRNEKGNLKFPLSKPIPYNLIIRVALALAEEYNKK